MPPTHSNTTIDATPTKELFIYMLTRDITLVPAILDLADNCCDGARKLKGSGSYSGLEIRIELSKDSFRISDNCGGISEEIARTYAFRFGRPTNVPSEKHSIGLFGVGMKRALFKLGKEFKIDSVSERDSWTVEVDVTKWAKEVDSEGTPTWEFKFKNAPTKAKTSNPVSKRGTVIHVSSLYPEIANEFELGNVVLELRHALQSRLQEPLSRKLSISVNTIPVTGAPLTLLSAKHIEPVHVSMNFPGIKPTKCLIYCGLGESADTSSAGWHVFCNGRLLVEGDKSALTGWGEENMGITIPSFHSQYNHLRGYVFLDCDDPALLPWNTTKTSVNPDSAIYRAVRLKMIQVMRPVVDFLNKVSAEKRKEGGPGELQKMIAKSKPIPLSEIEERPSFEIPQAKLVKLPPRTTQRIQYDRPISKIQQVKAVLGAKTLTELGEKTFEYFYAVECKK